MAIRTESDGGFVTLDAMMALVILSISIAMTLSSARIALRLGAAAEESRAADRLLSYLIDDGAVTVGATRGQTERFEWIRNVVVTSIQPLQLCRRDVQARARQTHRADRTSRIGT